MILVIVRRACGCDVIERIRRAVVNESFKGNETQCIDSGRVDVNTVILLLYVRQSLVVALRYILNLFWRLR